MYVKDYDKDGFLDLILPVELYNQVVVIQNPGKQFWQKIEQLASLKSETRQELKGLKFWDILKVTQDDSNPV